MIVFVSIEPFTLLPFFYLFLLFYIKTEELSIEVQSGNVQNYPPNTALLIFLSYEVKWSNFGKGFSCVYRCIDKDEQCAIMKKVSPSFHLLNQDTEAFQEMFLS